LEGVELGVQLELQREL